ncbi:unnamed protein product, partial [Mesorhabditis belari]|uniref:MD-2-related lipid-recognition domain-containing protein n=1 Tax=Mesorhabditis belari TaxID=2138241 RepID=A0AAF3FT29_9BILA
MQRLVYLACLIAFAAACDQQWPNGTDKALTWFPSCKSPVTFYKVTALDSKGKAEYPIKLTEPLIIQADLNNPNNQYDSPNLLSTVNLWSWGSSAGCQWTTVPTLNLLKDLDACTNGVPCPVKTGRQILPITLDFTKFQQIIKLLKNDNPYQMEMVLNDKKSKDQTCVIAQARCLTV